MSEEMVLLGKACLDVALMRWRMQTRRSVLRRDSAMVSLSGQQCDSRGDQQSGAGRESKGAGISKQTDLYRYDLSRRKTVEFDRIALYPHGITRSPFLFSRKFDSIQNPDHERGFSIASRSVLGLAAWPGRSRCLWGPVCILFDKM